MAFARWPLRRPSGVQVYHIVRVFAWMFACSFAYLVFLACTPRAGWFCPFLACLVPAVIIFLSCLKVQVNTRTNTLTRDTNLFWKTAQDSDAVDRPTLVNSLTRRKQ